MIDEKLVEISMVMYQEGNSHMLKNYLVNLANDFSHIQRRLEDFPEFGNIMVEEIQCSVDLPGVPGNPLITFFEGI